MKNPTIEVTYITGGEEYVVSLDDLRENIHHYYGFADAISKFTTDIESPAEILMVHINDQLVWQRGEVEFWGIQVSDPADPDAGNVYTLSRRSAHKVSKQLEEAGCSTYLLTPSESKLTIEENPSPLPPIEGMPPMFAEKETT